jgi:pimeloyl-ACP methyl ester carboxylesterase
VLESVKYIRADGSKVHEFEDCGHWLYLEQPNKFLKHIAEFFD